MYTISRTIIILYKNMKNLIPVVAILLLLGVGGYYFMTTKNAKPPVIEQKAGGEAKVAQQQGGNILTSIKDALSKSISLKCDYPDPVTKANITSYIKNGAVRVTNMTMGKEGTGDAIMKDNKMWIWSTGNKQGMMLTLNTKSATGGVPTGNQSEQVLAEMEKYKNYCKTEVVSDSLFTPPTDVNFSDLQNLFKNAGIPSGMPSGIPNLTPPAQSEGTNE